jgi:hypothetical protein
VADEQANVSQNKQLTLQERAQWYRGQDWVDSHLADTLSKAIPHHQQGQTLQLVEALNEEIE